MKLKWALFFIICNACYGMNFADKCLKAMMGLIEGKPLQVLLKWKSTDQFELEHFADIVPKRNRDGVVFLTNPEGRHEQTDFLFQRLAIANGDYTPGGEAAKNPTHTLTEYEVNYRPIGRIPWVKYHPLRPVAKALGASDEALYGLENILQARKVKLLKPDKEAPEGGFPVVLMSHGSLAPHQAYRPQEINVLGGSVELPFGGYNEARLVHGLLESGYAVMFLEAELSMVWTTNGPLVRHLPQLTSDHYFLRKLVQVINNGEIADVNPAMKFALGISSGGYNTSRLAHEFPEEFEAVVIQAAGQMKNLGPIFTATSDVAANHPATLFMHGAMDTIVPINPALEYYNALKAADVESYFGIFDGGHAWNDEAPSMIANFFNQFL